MLEKDDTFKCYLTPGALLIMLMLINPQLVSIIWKSFRSNCLLLTSQTANPRKGGVEERYRTSSITRCAREKKKIIFPNVFFPCLY